MNQPRAVTFRPATARDIEAVVALVESAYRGDVSREGWTTEADLLGGQRTDRDAVTELLARSDSLILLAMTPAGGNPVACAHLERQAGSASFGLFAVRPSLQRSGVGGALLAEAERVAVERWGSPRVELTVIRQRQDLVAWYERRGYRRTGETRPFPYGDERYGRPRRSDLEFTVLVKPLAS